MRGDLHRVAWEGTWGEWGPALMLPCQQVREHKQAALGGVHSAGFALGLGPRSGVCAV